MKDETNLNEQEGRLCDLLFEVSDDLNFINMVMGLADDLELFDECSDFIEQNPDCTKGDIYKFIADSCETEIVEE